MAAPAAAQQIDLSHGGPFAITADQGIEWHQVQQEVIAVGDAKAVRDNVTVTADRLIAWYRKKGGAAAAGARATRSRPGLTGDTDTGGNEVYRVKAEGNVHIFTQTDQVLGRRGDLRPRSGRAGGHRARPEVDHAHPGAHRAGRHGILVAAPHGRGAGRRGGGDERWPPAPGRHAGGLHHRGVGNGVPRGVPGASQAAGQTATQVAATQVAATTGRPAAAQDPLASSGKLEKVEAYGHVVVRTATDMVTGDRAVYVPDTGIARVAGQVRITRGQNQLDGSEAEVDLKTGISRLIAGNTGRVQGLVMPNDQSGASSPKPASPAPHAGKHP